jgi:hypothetical protein
MTVLALVAVVAIVGAGCGARSDESDGSDGSGDFVEIPGIGATRMDVPRPTGVASAPCDEDPLPPSTAQSLVERVAALRAIGLFADRAKASDDALVAQIDAAFQARWGVPDPSSGLTPLPPDDPFLDLFVAEQDASRVWWNDLEADVADGNEVYVDTLTGWGAISDGAFSPDAIEETWDGDGGPVTVTFNREGVTQTLRPAYLEDWIDPGILVPINALIADSGRRFELYKAFDQTAFVMAITDVERQALEARGWCFE